MTHNLNQQAHVNEHGSGALASQTAKVIVHTPATSSEEPTRILTPDLEAEKNVKGLSENGAAKLRGCVSNCPRSLAP